MSGLVALGLGVWLGVAFVYRAFALGALGRVARARHKTPDPVPPGGEVVLLRPLRGAGAQLDACLESLWRAAETTRTRIVVGFAHADDPAGPHVARVSARHPEVWAEAHVGQGPAGVNRKMANLVQMTEGVTGDLLVISDADVRVPLDYVPRMVGAFKDERVGLVTCLYRSVPAASLASRLDALVTNTHFVLGVCSALRLAWLDLGLGASIAVRREALTAAGGFEALLGVAADDALLARRIGAAGWRVVFEPGVVEHRLEDEGWRAIARRQVRWARVSRSTGLGGYVGQIVTHGALPALGLALAALLGVAPPLAVLAPLVWWGVQIPALWRQREPLGLRASDLVWIPAADLAAFASWVAGLVGRARPS